MLASLAVPQFALQLVEGDQTVHYIWSPRKQLRDNTRPSRREQMGADGSRREQTGGDGRRGLVVARSGVGGGRVWARLAPGSGRVAQPPWSRHHPVLTSGTWAHPHNHWFHDMWRSSLFFVTLKVPIIYSDKRTFKQETQSIHSPQNLIWQQVGRRCKTLPQTNCWHLQGMKTSFGIWKWSLYTFLCISVVWVKRPGVTEAEGDVLILTSMSIYFPCFPLLLLSYLFLIDR